MGDKCIHLFGIVCRKSLFFLFIMATVLFLLSWAFLLGSTGLSHLTDNSSLPSPGKALLLVEHDADTCDPERAILKVFMYDLPPEYHFGLLGWKPGAAGSNGVWPDITKSIPGYPGGLNLQHSIEYWLTLDILSSRLPNRPGPCAAVRVVDAREADVVFVPFFSSLSFNRFTKVQGNLNRVLQGKLVKYLTEQEEWKRSGGRDHIVMAHHPNSMMDARAKLWPCVFILSDFGRYPPHIANVKKDVIAPYRHMIKRRRPTQAEMAESMEEAATMATGSALSKKRKLKQGKGKNKPNKKIKPFAKPKNPSQKMKKLFKKRANAYNSDEDEEEEADTQEEGTNGERSSDEEEREEAEGGGSDGEDETHTDDVYHLGITKFSEGCRAFRTAFFKATKAHLPNDPLGPILAAQKKLVAEKLLEEETEHKAKGEAKKEKHLAGEKGHVKPANVLDTKERLLISTATKGVVKLFNAVNKAQNPQKGLNPSRSKDAKELAKRRKQTFLSELKKSTTGTPYNSSQFNSSKFTQSDNREKDDEPGWAPLRDSYMLNNSKLKDWDKMADPAAVADQGTLPLEGSSDED